MSDKDLQRVTECVSDIGQPANDRRALPPRRNHITQKVKIAGKRTLYISIHNDEQPAEVFLRVKGPDCSSELIGLYDVVARLMSLALRYGAPRLRRSAISSLGLDLNLVAPSSGTIASSTARVCRLDWRYLLVEFCGRYELGHVPVAVRVEGAP
jgi:hypothetical protein